MWNKRTCFALFILHANWGKWCKRWCLKTFCLSNRSILYWREQAASHDFSHDPTNPVPFGAGNESYVSFFNCVTACRAFTCSNMIGLLMYILFNFGVPLRLCQVHEILFPVSDTHTQSGEKCSSDMSNPVSQRVTDHYYDAGKKALWATRPYHTLFRGWKWTLVC